MVPHEDNSWAPPARNVSWPETRISCYWNKPKPLGLIIGKKHNGEGTLQKPETFFLSFVKHREFLRREICKNELPVFRSEHFQSDLHSLTAAPRGQNHCSYFENTLAFSEQQLCYNFALPDPLL